MKYETARMGEINIGEDAVLRFENGIPGFEELRLFTLLDLEDGLPFKLMQSLDQPDVSFVVGDPFFFYPDYEWELPESVQEELEISSEQDVQVWSIVTVSSNLSEATINLLAPIVLNRVRKVGKQHILHNTEYAPRHPLLRSPGENRSSTKGEG